MLQNKFGELIYTEDDICSQVMQGKTLNFASILVDTEIKVNDLADFLDHVPKFVKYNTEQELLTVEQYDQKQQSNWYMPDEYKQLDIAEYILNKCKSDAELQRAGQELLLFVEHNLIDLLRYLKYLVDTMRKHNIVWGVGRGSSVASFVLYLLDVHRVNSLYYDLPIEEFLH
jgi:DNA polymerase III alpha subunit